jgi:hypothetical protein
MTETATCIQVAPYLQTIARKCIERMDELGMKGKRRDDATLDYFCGAAQGLSAAGDTRAASHVGYFVAVVLSIGGYGAVISIAKD